MSVRFFRIARCTVAVLLIAALAACGSGTATPGVSGSSVAGPSPSPPPIAGAPSQGSAALNISGSPPAATLVDSAYSFQPSASSASGNALRFSITGQPGWASFDPATGALTGTPAAADVGSYSITIAVTDGSSQASLPFTLNVVQLAPARATVSWVAPLHRTDGTPLQNLAGFRVYYGSQPGALRLVINVINPGATSAVVENLTPGTWYFAAAAVDASGLESAPSYTASKVI